jgi:hypothetical protein
MAFIKRPIKTKGDATYLATALKRGGWTGVRIQGSTGKYKVKYNK